MLRTQSNVCYCVPPPESPTPPCCRRCCCFWLCCCVVLLSFLRAVLLFCSANLLRDFDRPLFMSFFKAYFFSLLFCTLWTTAAKLAHVLITFFQTHDRHTAGASTVVQPPPLLFLPLLMLCCCAFFCCAAAVVVFNEFVAFCPPTIVSCVFSRFVFFE